MNKDTNEDTIKESDKVMIDDIIETTVLMPDDFGLKLLVTNKQLQVT